MRYRNLVDVAFRCGIHTLANARGEQLVIRNGKGLLCKAQQVVSGFISPMNDDLHKHNIHCSTLHWVPCKDQLKDGGLGYCRYLANHIKSTSGYVLR